MPRAPLPNPRASPGVSVRTQWVPLGHSLEDPGGPGLLHHHPLSEPCCERALALLRATNPALTTEGQLTGFQGIVERLQQSSPGSREAEAIHDPATWSAAWRDSYHNIAAAGGAGRASTYRKTLLELVWHQTRRACEDLEKEVWIILRWRAEAWQRLIRWLACVHLPRRTGPGADPPCWLTTRSTSPWIALRLPKRVCW